MSDWLPMRYRDFYDIPRAIVVERGGRTYLLDSPFDDELSEYADDCSVYELPAAVAEQLDEIAWTDLEHRGRLVGTVPTAQVRFDPTRRRALDSGVFDHLGL